MCCADFAQAGFRCRGGGEKSIKITRNMSTYCNLREICDTDTRLTDTRLIKQASRAEDKRDTLAEFEAGCVLPFHPCRDRLPGGLKHLDVGLVNGDNCIRSESQMLLFRQIRQKRNRSVGTSHRRAPQARYRWDDVGAADINAGDMSEERLHCCVHTFNGVEDLHRALKVHFLRTFFASFSACTSTKVHNIRFRVL